MTEIRENWDREWFNRRMCCEQGCEENCRVCLVYLQAWRDELYSKITCALTHNLEVCDKCQKCGSDWRLIRLNLIKELEGFTGKPATPLIKE